jgi:hypothetical protein
LAEERTVRAVEFLTDLLWRYRNYDWDIGAKGHALHALALYDERLFGGRLGERAEQLAEHRETRNTLGAREIEEPPEIRAADSLRNDRSIESQPDPPSRRRRRFR